MRYYYHTDFGNYKIVSFIEDHKVNESFHINLNDLKRKLIGVMYFS
jgi:hypothetical protein